MARIKYLGGMGPIYRGNDIAVAVDSEIDVPEAVAADLVKSHPRCWEIVERRQRDKPDADRMVKGAPQNRSRK